MTGSWCFCQDVKSWVKEECSLVNEFFPFIFIFRSLLSSPLTIHFHGSFASFCQCLFARSCNFFWCRMSRHSISWIRLCLDLTPVVGNERRARSDLEEDKHHLMKHLLQIWPWQHFHIRGTSFTLERGYHFFFESRVNDKIYFFPSFICSLFPLFLPSFRLNIFMIIFDLLHFHLS